MLTSIRFLWVVFHIETLRRCNNLPILRKELACLPITLEDTYNEMLNSIGKENYRYALRVFQWLAFSARPLRLNEVAELNTVNVKEYYRFDSEIRICDPWEVLTVLPGLITTVTATDSASSKDTAVEIRFVHFSVKEYLLSEEIRSGPSNAYSIQENSANACIAEVCLAHLLRFDKPDSLLSQSPGEFSLARYAAQNWVQHAQKAKGVSSRVHSLSMELFLAKRCAFVNWIRLCDPDNPSREPDLTQNDKMICSPLYYASHAGLYELVKQILDRGVDVNARGGRYGNALQAASNEGHEEVLQLLLDEGFDLDAQGGEYDNAQQSTVFTDNIKAVLQPQTKNKTKDESERLDIEMLAPSSHPFSDFSEEIASSSRSIWPTEEFFIAKNEILFTFATDTILQPLYSSGLKTPSIDTDKFEKTLCRLLQLYAKELDNEAKGELQKETAQLVLIRAKDISMVIGKQVEMTHIQKSKYMRALSMQRPELGKLLFLDRYLSAMVARKKKTRRRKTSFIPEDNFDVPKDTFLDFAFDTDFTSNQDSDENHLADGSPAILPSLTQVKQFMVQSRAFENLCQRLNRFLRPDPDVSTKTFPLAVMYGADTGRVLKFTPWTMTPQPGFIDQIKDVLEKLIRNPILWWPLQPKRTRCPNGYRRVSWSCVS